MIRVTLMLFDLQQISRDSRDALNFLGESSHEYYFCYDFAGRIALFSRNMWDRFALPRAEDDTCTPHALYEIVHPQDRPIVTMQFHRLSRGETDTYDGKYRLRAKTGEYIWVRSCGKSQLNEKGQPVWMIGRISVSEAEPGQRPDVFDLNRLKQDAEVYLAEKMPASLLVIGVDNLRSINLKHGRSFGDDLLARLYAAFEEAVYGRERVYHTVGDCYAAILPHTDEEKVTQVFRYVQQRLTDCCTLSAGCVPLQTYKIPDAETLYQYAEVTLAAAKRQGRDKIVFFSAEDYEKEISALELKDEMKRSVESDFRGFFLAYQPQVRTNSGRLYGAEALLRYRSEQRGVISPVEFIPLLEQSGLIGKVGLWVLRQSLAQCKAWRARVPDMHISVNLSFAQLYQEGVAQDVLDALAESGLPGSALTLEVTESLELMEYARINEIFRLWKLNGIEISVDDFGTGYSGLSRLKDLEVDEIKIDGMFINNIHRSAYNYRLLSNMIQLADSSRIRVCCEGVESEDELRVLQELHPMLLQGYLVGRPGTPKQLEELFMETDSAAYLERQEQIRRFNATRSRPPISGSPCSESELALKVLNSESNIYYISDPETYELYYLNPAGQSLFGVRDYQGRKCYRVLQGRDTPCPNCTNAQLRQDGFYVWDHYNEYCNRHFLLRDKLIEYSGRLVRLEIASDITKHENVSRDTGERLEFAQKIVENTAILAGESRYDEAVDKVLASVGQYYQADRAYLFQPTPSMPGFWDNTFEWCAPGVEPQHGNLQKVPPKAVKRWMEQFARNRTVVLLNIDTIRDKSPDEWQTLQAQNITRLIAVPLRDGGSTVGFIGVDNPRHSIRDDSQIRVLAHFLITRLHQQRNEHRYQELLRAENRDVFSRLGLGLWVIYLDAAANLREMLGDDTMNVAMGVDRSLSPAEYYDFWYTRINPGYYEYVDRSVQNMVDSGKVVQLEYTWKHPLRGDVMVRCTGVRTADENGCICLKGYHRIVDDVEQRPYLPAACDRDIFEFNELTGNIFFHTRRVLLQGEAQQEQHFPQSWIDSGLVHSAFAQAFTEAFSRLRMRDELGRLQVQLRGKSGSYEWFRLTLQHLSQKLQDLDTILVMVEPMGAQRDQEVEYMRMRRFYQVLLSEAIAYAEVDLDRDDLQAAGGVWHCYEKDYLHTGRHFFQELTKALANSLTKEEMRVLQEYGNAAAREKMFAEGNLNHRFYYRRNIGNELHWVELTVYLFREQMSGSVYALLYLKDVNAEKERELAQLDAANRDPLTAIYNRSAFEREMTRSIIESTASPCGYLLLLDVDDFKQINDVHGHMEGDTMLKMVSHQLLQTFRKGDVIGRMGGDEFLVYIRGSIPRESLEQRLTHFLEQLRTNSHNMLTCSMGLTLVTSEHFDYARSLSQADTAMYHSKRHGKNNFSFFEDLNS